MYAPPPAPTILSSCPTHHSYGFCLLSYKFTTQKLRQSNPFSVGFINYQAVVYVWHFDWSILCLLSRPLRGSGAWVSPRCIPSSLVPPFPHTASSVFTSASFLLVPFLRQRWRLRLMIGSSESPLCPPSYHVAFLTLIGQFL